jgi:peptidoglycan/xylan/chitin deacetylase (PgdA/CDA1 family)
VYWSDWALNPAPDETDGVADAAAIARYTDAGGRVAWFGFRIDQGVTPRDSVYLARTLRNGVLWAAGTPVAELTPWPDGHRSALMLSVAVESQPEHAAPLADLLRQRGIPVTWFPASRRVEGSGPLGPTLARAGEIGAQTPDQAPVVGLPPADQRVRLDRAVSEIQRWAGGRPVGFRPSEEAFDVATVDAWHRTGGRYLVALNHARTASPEIHPVAGSPGGMVLLPRLVKDDYNVFVQDGAMRSERLGDAYTRGMGKIHALGGLAVVSAHTQTLDSDNRRQALLSAGMAARAQEGWWVARGAEIADWWRARSRVRVAAERPDPDEVVFSVVASEEGLAGGWLDVVVPQREGRVPLRDGEPVAYEATPWGLRLPLGAMEPGAHVEVRLVPPPEGPPPPAAQEQVEAGASLPQPRAGG